MADCQDEGMTQNMEDHCFPILKVSTCLLCDAHLGLEGSNIAVSQDDGYSFVPSADGISALNLDS